MIYSTKNRIIILLLSIFLYIVLFFLLYNKLGINCTKLSLFPVLVAGMFFGLRIGFVSGIANIGLFIILVNIVGVNPLNELARVSVIMDQTLILTIGSIVGFIHDTSVKYMKTLVKLQHYEKKLRQSERLYRETVESANSIILKMDMEGNITFLNRFAYEFFGYSKDEIIGKNIETILPENIDGTQRVRTLLDEIQQNPEKYILHKNKNIKKNGEIVWISWSNKLITDEDGNAEGIISMGVDITKEKLLEEQLKSANEKMQNEIRDASKIQMALLPDKDFAVPEVNFYWLYNPCESLGGDTLNIFRLDEKHLAFYIADVSGHGAPASFLSFMINKLLFPSSDISILTKKDKKRLIGHSIRKPSEVAETLNNIFQMDDRNNQFFTILYCTLNLETLKLHYVSAGNPPIIYLPEDGEIRIIENPGFPIGLTEKPEYSDNRLMLKHGDMLFIYTDGLIEQTNTDGIQFGIERLCKILNENSNRNMTPKELVDKVNNGVNNWAGNKDLDDDITIFALKAN